VIADGEPADMVAEFRVGLSVRPNDIQGLVRALRQLSEDVQLARALGNNGRNTALQHFRRRDILQRFEGLLTANEDAMEPGSKAFIRNQTPRIEG
jgi:glycosyltransferase involved in cell wall biosynthesis